MSRKEDLEEHADDWGDDSLKNPVTFRRWFQILFRVWRPYLSANQFQIALFVFDRTAGWGKEWEIITNKQFLTGVIGRDKKVYATGLEITRYTLSSNRDELVARKIILTRTIGNRTAYSLNYEWNPEQPEPMSLKKPKRLAAGDPSKQLEKGSTTDPQKGSTTDPKEEKGKKLRKSKVSPTEKLAGGEALPEEDLDEILETASAKSQAATMKKIERWTTASAIPAWVTACKAHHPDSMLLALTNTDGIILHRYGNRYRKAKKGRTINDWLVYLEWNIAHWSLVKQKQFAWMKGSAPGVPSIRFLVKFSEKFEAAWEEREHLEKMATLSGRDRSVAAKVRRGMPQEAAEKEVDDRLGLTRERERIEAAAASIKRTRVAMQGDLVDKAKADERNAKWKSARQRPTEGTFDVWK